MNLFKKKDTNITFPITESDHREFFVEISSGQRYSRDLYDFLTIAENGNTSIMKLLGEYFVNGKNGVPKDEKRGFYYYKMAADYGDAVAQYIVFSFYDDESSDINASKSERRNKSLQYLKLSAQQDYPYAQRVLAMRYFCYNLESLDVVIELLCKSYIQGDTLAYKALEEMVSDGLPRGWDQINEILSNVKKTFNPRWKI